MPNTLAVYMHDTPAKRLFGADYRFLSHGCVRVQGVYDLAAWLLEGTDGAPGRRRLGQGRAAGRDQDWRPRGPKVTRPTPVIWVYLTGWANADGPANFRDDVYGLDAAGDATAPLVQDVSPAPVARRDAMSAARPLQNRVDPYGALVAVAARGALMGNRGGRIHRPDQTLARRRWASRQWIVCVCAFRGRQRRVWGDSYSELFFLDEPTALASGHRPCFECRRADALAYRRAFSPGGAPSAAEMDFVLHRERLAHFAGRYEEASLAELPDGTMVERAGRPYAVRGRPIAAVELFRLWRS